MSEEETIKTILDEAIHIHRSIGPGILENVYKTRLAEYPRLHQCSMKKWNQEGFEWIW